MNWSQCPLGCFCTSIHIYLHNLDKYVALKLQMLNSPLSLYKRRETGRVVELSVSISHWSSPGELIFFIVLKSISQRGTSDIWTGVSSLPFCVSNALTTWCSAWENSISFKPEGISKNESIHERFFFSHSVKTAQRLVFCCRVAVCMKINCREILFICLFVRY